MGARLVIANHVDEDGIRVSVALNLDQDRNGK